MFVALALVLGLVVFDVVRRPSLRRLAARNIVRRPGEAALVVLGSMLGTAIICTAFIVGDTFGESIRAIAPQKLGEVDIEIVATEPSKLLPALAAADLGSIEGIDGTLPLLRIGATATTVGDDRVAETMSGLIELDFDAARAFGSDPATTGLVDAGATPAPGEAVIGRDLADELVVEPGDTIEVFGYGTSRQLVVRDVVDRKGLAGYGSYAWNNLAPTVFVAPGTIDGMRAEGKAPAAIPPDARLLVSADGGVFAETSTPVFDEIERRLDGVDGASVYAAKDDLLEDAEREADGMQQLFSGIGGFSVIAGILLLVNIFVMLAEERKAELGVLRAVGLKRNHLVRTFGIEGAIYAAIASVVGGVVGIGIGRAISSVAARLMDRGNEGGGLDMIFTVKPASVITAMLVGLLISMVTIWGTSLRIGRLNIIRAIREQAEPPRDPRSRRSLVLGILGVAVGLLILQAGVGGRSAPPTSLGPAVALFSTILLLRRRIPERIAASVPAALVVLYELTCFAIFPDSYVDPSIATFVVQGVTTSAAAVVLAASNADFVAGAGERLTGSSLAARLGSAYPLARRFRTGLLLGVYTLIIFTLTFMATLSNVFQAQTPRVADQMRGGFDLFVTSSWTNPATKEQIAAQDGVDVVASFRRGSVQFQRDGQEEPEWWAVSGFDAGLLEGGAPDLEQTWQGLSESEAWEMAAAGVLSAPDGEPMVFLEGGPGSAERPTPIPAIIPSFFLQNGNGPPQQSPKPGMLVDIVDPTTDERVELLAVGIVAGDWAGNGVFVADSFLQSFVEPTTVPRHFVRVTEAADPEAVAERITTELIPQGADARTFREMVALGTSTQAGFFRLIEGYLGLGLLIGVAGLGVVMVRAVRERRKEIGMLRAMGLQSSMVRRAFLLEAAFIAAQGIVVGIALGLLTSWSVLSNSEAFSAETGVQFAVPWGTVVVLLVVPMLASLLGVLAPANSASRVRPAIALRIAD
ncbi:MAG TPA: FtsX-like permease family protein [Acidimicrobiales bacterium]|nr:FtsX-like permease family protein [Acidimicrobiales bacterium]